MDSIRNRIPTWGQVLAWLGIISTILGIIGFFIADLPGVFGNDNPQGLTEEQIVATLAALQEGKQDAELQLTQIALEDASAANLQTQQALDAQQVSFQATLNAVQAAQEAFVATQNAVAAANATATAIEQAALDAAATNDAIATQNVEDATATANFLAQITPTPTSTPTPTVTPSPTPTPAPVTDHRKLNSSIIVRTDEGALAFSLRTASPIPASPRSGLSYVWSLDEDRKMETGVVIHDIGVDRRVIVRYEEGAWVGIIRTIQADGTLGDLFVFSEIVIDGPDLVAFLVPEDYDLPSEFFWVVRAELGGNTYSLLPAEGHYIYRPQ